MIGSLVIGFVVTMLRNVSDVSQFVNEASLLSTHIVSDVEAIATEIVVIHQGRKLQHAAPETLLQLLEGQIWQI